jgi:NADH dehydrogenase
MAHEVLILGGGFGGLTAARRLERKLAPQAAKVTLVNDVNFMLYTPLLPGAAGGTLEPRHVVVPLREQLRRTELHLGDVLGADPDRRVVHVRSIGGLESELRYDQLIVALGSTSRTLPIPGLAEHALGFKTLSEAISLRNRLVQSLEQAEIESDEIVSRALLTYVFVGAGYAGLEGIAELQDFAADLVQHYPRAQLHGLRFVLVEAKDRVMTEIQPDLATFASAELRRRGIEIHTATTIERVAPESVELSTGEIVPTRTLVWTAGVKPHPVIANLGLPLDGGGRIM